MTTSIIIITRDRQKLLLSLVSYLIEHYQVNELIIIDNSNNPVKKSEILKLKPPFKINLHTSHTHHIAKLRNLGLKYTHSDIIFFLDDDVIPDKNLILKTVKFFQKHPSAIACTGRIIPTIYNAWSEISAYYWQTYQIPKSTKTIFAPTACLALRSEFIKKHKIKFNHLFSKTGEDIDFLLKCGKYHGEVWKLSSLTHQHLFPHTPLAFYRKHQTYANDMLKIYQKNHQNSFKNNLNIWQYLPKKHTSLILRPFVIIKKTISSTYLFMHNYKISLSQIIPCFILHFALITGVYNSKEAKHYFQSKTLLC